jgi:carboxymethylenebutenolidase
MRRPDVGALGFSLGGRAAFLACALVPLKCAVSFYGVDIAPGSLDKAPDAFSPLLLLWGGLDKQASPEQARQVCDALRQHHKPFVSVDFSFAGHGFFCDARSSYQPEAAKQAWALLLQFLRSPASA